MAINIVDYLPIGSAVVSILSLLIAARLAWVTKLGPPRLVGIASCLLLYTNQSAADGSIRRHLVPRLWLANTGARPMLILHMYLTITLRDGQVIRLIPAHSVPLEAIDSANTFDNLAGVDIGLAPYGGFAILPGERWVNNYAFEVSPSDFQLLKGHGRLSLTVRALDANKSRTVIEQPFFFGMGGVQKCLRHLSLTYLRPASCTSILIHKNYHFEGEMRAMRILARAVG